MWGQDDVLVMSEALQRIIPTRVGTSQVWQAEHGLCRDHPHACGDKKRQGRVAGGWRGSSPRVWGQVDTDYNNSLANRIIPTRVGTSILIDEIGTILKDHPHACGDKSGLKVLFMIVIGSSPRVWGQGSSNHLYSQLTRDHPHACGDKLRNCVLFSVNIRIIPTRVGTRQGQR